MVARGRSANGQRALSAPSARADPCQSIMMQMTAEQSLLGVVAAVLTVLSMSMDDRLAAKLFCGTLLRLRARDVVVMTCSGDVESKQQEPSYHSPPLDQPCAVDRRDKMAPKAMRRVFMAEIQIPVSIGELLDKITILQIKVERLSQAHQLVNVERELAALNAVWQRWGLCHPEVEPLQAALKAVNLRLWDIEDALRQQEAQQRFDAKFIALARSVYKENDQRAALKRQINQITGSLYIEEKSYQPYQRDET